MDQTYLVSGKRVSLRLWQNEKPQKKAPSKRDYETVGYVLSGEAELILEGQTVTLEPGDSWLVPAGTEHAYRILTEFTAIEATAPPAQVHGRHERARKHSQPRRSTDCQPATGSIRASACRLRLQPRCACVLAIFREHTLARSNAAASPHHLSISPDKRPDDGSGRGPVSGLRK